MQSRYRLARRTVEMSVIALGVAVFFVLLWYIGNAFLIIFAGILFAGLLDAAITGLGKIVRIDRRIRFALVLALFTVALGAFLATWGMLAA